MLTSIPAYAENTPCKPGSTCNESISWQRTTRSFTYYLPKTYARTQRYFNLVIALHGAGETGSFLEKQILHGSLDKIALRTRSIVVYPDAVQGAWNYNSETASPSPDDVGFINAVMQYFETNYFVNPFRMYVTGIGEGGFLAYRLACESADKITAIATVDAAMTQALMTTCKPARHIPILMINGKDDPILPWDGHEMLSLTGEKARDRLSIPESYQAWLQINNIHTVPNQQPVSAPVFDSTWAWKKTAKALDGTEVILYTIYAGGHTWPGGAQYLPEQYIGKTSAMNASEIIWQFFISNRLQPLAMPDYIKKINSR
jgi:polyhydroxybutyrate depolymerase